VYVCVEKENHTALKQKAFVLFDNFREHGHIRMHGERFKIKTSIHTKLPQPLAKPTTNP